MEPSEITTAKGPPTNRVRLAELREHLMTLVDETTVPCGILHTPPGPPALALADGTAAAPPISKQLWRELYFNLRNSALSSVHMATLDEIEEQAAKYRESGITPISIAHYRYCTPRSHFVARVQAYAERGGTFKMPDRAQPQSVLKEQIAFFATALLKHEFDLFFPQPPTHYGLTAQFVLPSDLCLTNTNSRPSAVLIDLDDGRGEQPVAFDEPFAASYAEPGLKHIRLIASLDGTTLQSTFEFDVQVAAAPPPNETWVNIISALRFNNVTTTGHAWVYYGRGHTGLVNPVIVAEGFPGGYSLDYLWSALNQQNLITNLLQKGKDVIILGFDQGTSYIEANAGVAITCIKKAIAQRRGSDRLVIGGASMGGLITRYALTWMEAASMDHQTSLYFSFDSPHQGANVPVSVMYFLSYFASQSDAVRQANEKILSPASQEMLLCWLPGYQQKLQTPSQLRQTFVTNITRVGNFPKKPRKVGVANGVGSGQGNPTPRGSNTFYWSYNGCAGSYLYSAPGDLYDSGYKNLIAEPWYVSWEYFYLKYPGDPSFDSAPGGTSDFFKQLADAIANAGYGRPTLRYALGCFIPAISALAMSTLNPYADADLFRDLRTRTPPSLLDAYQWDTQNDPHVTITPALASWLLGQIDVAAAEEERSEAELVEVAPDPNGYAVLDS